ncbi:hypothetical protein NX059_010385 [Plenodomus lindquistii]|nr:hypothetical protein NX059_010385 [Plenodomus lindquistii]
MPGPGGGGESMGGRPPPFTPPSGGGFAMPTGAGPPPGLLSPFQGAPIAPSPSGAPHGGDIPLASPAPPIPPKNKRKPPKKPRLGRNIKTNNITIHNSNNGAAPNADIKAATGSTENEPSASSPGPSGAVSQGEVGKKGEKPELGLSGINSVAVQPKPPQASFTSKFGLSSIKGVQSTPHPPPSAKLKLSGVKGVYSVQPQAPQGPGVQKSLPAAKQKPKMGFSAIRTTQNIPPKTPAKTPANKMGMLGISGVQSVQPKLPLGSPSPAVTKRPAMGFSGVTGVQSIAPHAPLTDAKAVAKQAKAQQKDGKKEMKEAKKEEKREAKAEKKEIKDAKKAVPNALGIIIGPSQPTKSSSTAKTPERGAQGRNPTEQASAAYMMSGSVNTQINRMQFSTPKPDMSKFHGSKNAAFKAPGGVMPRRVPSIRKGAIMPGKKEKKKGFFGGKASKNTSLVTAVRGPKAGLEIRGVPARPAPALSSGFRPPPQMQRAPAPKKTVFGLLGSSTAKQKNAKPTTPFKAVKPRPTSPVKKSRLVEIKDDGTPAKKPKKEDEAKAKAVPLKMKGFEYKKPSKSEQARAKKARERRKEKKK